jgi:hypothetical protein
MFRPRLLAHCCRVLLDFDDGVSAVTEAAGPEIRATSFPINLSPCSEKEA